MCPWELSVCDVPECSTVTGKDWELNIIRMSCALKVNSSLEINTTFVKLSYCCWQCVKDGCCL